MYKRLSVASCILLLSLSSTTLFAKTKLKEKTTAATPYYIIVDKSDNTLTVYDSEEIGWCNIRAHLVAKT